jgi:hypothetical protein
MPISPEEFTKQYLPITVNACVGDPDSGEIVDGSPVSVSIKSYLNANNRLEPPPKNNPKAQRKQKKYEEGKGMPYYEMKDQVLQFLNARKKAKAYGIEEMFGAFYVPSVTPYIIVKPVAFMHAFTGKIGPATLRQVLSLLSYYYDETPSLKQRYSSLQNLADRCLGLDCNGLVGAYFESEYTYLKIEPNTAISGYDIPPIRKMVRTSVGEIRARDVILWPNYHHIAIISSVSGVSGGEVQCRVSQSRSAELGGAITSDAIIIKDKAGFRFKSGGEYFKNIVQVAPEGA